MLPPEKEALEASFVEQRTELILLIPKLERNLKSEYVRPQDKEKLKELLRTHYKRLGRTIEALDLLKSDDYGICTACHETIPVHDLLDNPVREKCEDCTRNKPCTPGPATR